MRRGDPGLGPGGASPGTEQKSAGKLWPCSGGGPQGKLSLGAWVWAGLAPCVEAAGQAWDWETPLAVSEPSGEVPGGRGGAVPGGPWRLPDWVFWNSVP